MKEMTDNEIFANEILCIRRRSRGSCNGGEDCNSCDLVMDEKEIISAYERAMKNVDLIKRKNQRIAELEAQYNDLFYKLNGVMLSVDKWLEGKELKQDEVNRAITMREKTLQIVEKLEAEVERLQSDNKILSKQLDNLCKELDAENLKNF